MALNYAQREEKEIHIFHPSIGTTRSSGLEDEARKAVTKGNSLGVAGVCRRSSLDCTVHPRKVVRFAASPDRIWWSLPVSQDCAYQEEGSPKQAGGRRSSLVRTMKGMVASHHAKKVASPCLPSKLGVAPHAA